jgi:hypothetical protein
MVLERRISTAGLLLGITLTGGFLVAAPRIHCDRPVYDFGKADNLDSITNVFVIRNTGDEPLKIKRVIGCCGARTELKDSMVAAGSNTSIAVVFSLKGRLGKEEKQFYVESNDPEENYYQLTLTGTAGAAIDIQPPVMDFGTIGTADRPERTASITVPDTNTAINITNVVCTSSNFAVRLTTLQPGTHYKVAVSNMSPLPPGLNIAEVKLAIDHPKYDLIDFVVVTRVIGNFIVVPSEVILFKHAQQGNISRTIMIKSRNQADFKIVDVNVPDRGIKVQHSSVSQGVYKLVLQDLPTGRDIDGKEVVINTDRGTIIVPIRRAVSN